MKNFTQHFLPRLNQYTYQIIEEYQCTIRSNRSIADHTFYFLQILDTNVNIMIKSSDMYRLQEIPSFS